MCDLVGFFVCDLHSNDDLDLLFLIGAYGWNIMWNINKKNNQPESQAVVFYSN